jgi:hypothetical protein
VKFGIATFVTDEGHNAMSQAFTQPPIPEHRGGHSTGVRYLYQIGRCQLAGAGGSSGRAVARGLQNRAGLRAGSQNA